MTTGILYDIGGAAYIVSGIQRGRHNPDGKFKTGDISEIMVGIVVVLGNLLLTFFGEREKKDPMTAYADALTKHLKEEGIVMPEPASATPETLQSSGVIDSVNRFLHKNAIQTVSLIKMSAGVFSFISGAKPGSVVPQKMAAGVISTTAWLATFAFDDSGRPPFEFKPDEEESTRSLATRVYRWVKDNPRAHVTAPFAMIFSMLTLWGANGERLRHRSTIQSLQGLEELTHEQSNSLLQAQRRQHDFVWNVLSACIYIVGGFIFAKSGDKKAPEVADNDQFTQELLTTSANVLTIIPENVRDHAIAKAAAHMATLKDVNQTKEEIAQAITERLETLRTDIHISVAYPSHQNLR